MAAAIRNLISTSIAAVGIIAGSALLILRRRVRRFIERPCFHPQRARRRAAFSKAPSRERQRGEDAPFQNCPLDELRTGLAIVQRAIRTAKAFARRQMPLIAADAARGEVSRKMKRDVRCHEIFYTVIASRKISSRTKRCK